MDVEKELDQGESDESQDEIFNTLGREKKEKKRKKGIIYISSIPRHMNVAICRDKMKRFGEVGRLFLQPEHNSRGSKLF